MARNATNKLLNKAKSEKNDEFYTILGMKAAKPMREIAKCVARKTTEENQEYEGELPCKIAGIFGEACRVMAKRLRDVCALPEREPLWRAGRGFVVRDLPWTVGKLRVIPPFEFENWAVQGAVRRHGRG